MLQFDRKATVIISGDGETGLSTSGLRIVFDIKKTSTPDFNTAKVSVYNLSETTRNQIKKLGGQIIVKAGYTQDSGEQVIFIGDISMASSEIVKPEVVTTFEANDGEKRIHSKKLSVSYKSGTGGKQIVKDIISATGFPLKNINWGSFPDKVYPRGFSFVGSAKVLMNNVCNYLGLEWSIQNDEVKLIKSGGSDGAQIIFLSPSSGIIGSPVRVKDVGTKSKEDTAFLGWKVTCLLQPLAEPGGVIKIKSAEVVEGLYRILDVQHSGDTHGNDWKSIITVSSL